MISVVIEGPADVFPDQVGRVIQSGLEGLDHRRFSRGVAQCHSDIAQPGDMPDTPDSGPLGTAQEFRLVPGE